MSTASNIERARDGMQASDEGITRRQVVPQRGRDSDTPKPEDDAGVMHMHSTIDSEDQAQAYKVTTYLPTELWHSILRISAIIAPEHDQLEVGKRRMTPWMMAEYDGAYHHPVPAGTFASLVDQATCHTCSLVCRRWRDIILPYLFTQVQLPNRDRTIPEFLDFLTAHPHIAMAVGSIKLHKYILLDVTHLDALVSCLPNLQKMAINCSSCLPYQHSEGNGLNHRKYTLEYLRLGWDRPSDDLFRCLLVILGFFSKIDRFEMCPCKTEIRSFPDYEISHEVAQDPIRLASSGSLSISSLSITNSLVDVISFLQPYLVGVGALGHISRLELDFEVWSNEEAFLAFNEMLEVAGPRLRRLAIFMPEFAAYATNTFRFQRGLSACAGLEEFSLYATLFPWYVQPRTSDIEFLGVVNTLFLVPTHHLLSLELKLIFDCHHRLISPGDVHSLPWQRLHEACHRFPRLHSLFLMTDVRLSKDFNHWWCFNYEMREVGAILQYSIDTQWDAAGQGLCGNADCERYNLNIGHSDVTVEANEAVA